GTTAATRNAISGNGGSGVVLETTGNTVLGNYIGMQANGVVGQGNAHNGVVIDADGNTVGGTSTAARNVISGNSGDGVYIASNNNFVQGNYIGITASDATTGGSDNGGNGVHVVGGSGNTVGGTTAGAGNVISNNTG